MRSRDSEDLARARRIARGNLQCPFGRIPAAPARIPVADARHTVHSLQRHIARSRMYYSCLFPRPPIFRTCDSLAPLDYSRRAALRRRDCLYARDARRLDWHSRAISRAPRSGRSRGERHDRGDAQGGAALVLGAGGAGAQPGEDRARRRRHREDQRASPRGLRSHDGSAGSLRAAHRPGTYVVTYHVVARDGHPTTGSYNFVLKAAGAK